MTVDYRRGIDWKAAVRGLPVEEPTHAEHDFDDLEEVLVCFISDLDDGTFLVWEAVIRTEQGLPLSEPHREVLSKAVSIGDEAVEDVHHIDELARPQEPWYETLRRIVPAMLVETFHTAEPENSLITSGWPSIVEALEEFGQHLSLPEGVTEAVDVIPEGLQHRLWLQSCFEALAGIGDEEFVVTEADVRERVEEFVEALKERKEDVQALGLTLEKLLKILVIPPKERKVFVKVVSSVLGLSSDTDPIADHL
jgi:hypothetical protein